MKISSYLLTYIYTLFYIHLLDLFNIMNEHDDNDSDNIIKHFISQRRRNQHILKANAMAVCCGV